MNLVSQNKAKDKVKVTLSVSKNARGIAEKLGLNMSAVLENTLVHGLFQDNTLYVLRGDVKKCEICQNTPYFSTIDMINEGLDMRALYVLISDFLKFQISNSASFPEIDTVLGENSSYVENGRIINENNGNYPHLIQCRDNPIIMSKNIETEPDKLQNLLFAYMDYLGSKSEKTNSYEYRKRGRGRGNTYVENVKVIPQTNAQTPMNEPDSYYGYVNEIFAKHKDKFTVWAKENGIATYGTLNSYVNNLESFSTIATPVDISEYKTQTGIDFNKSKSKSLKKFFRYLQDMADDETNVKINGYSLQSFESKMNKAVRNHESKLPMINKTVEDGKKLETKDILEYYSLIPDELQKLFKLAVYSGARIKQIIRLLDAKDKTIIECGEFIKVYGGNIQIGKNKKFIYLYLPAVCKSYVEKFSSSKLKTKYGKVYKYENLAAKMNKDLSSGLKATMKGLRKFNVNIMIDWGVDGVVVDYIQSRSEEKSVREISYQNMEKPADRAYSKVAYKFLELLPF